MSAHYSRFANLLAASVLASLLLFTKSANAELIILRASQVSAVKSAADLAKLLESEACLHLPNNEWPADAKYADPASWSITGPRRRSPPFDFFEGKTILIPDDTNRRVCLTFLSGAAGAPPLNPQLGELLDELWRQIQAKHNATIGLKRAVRPGEFEYPLQVQFEFFIDLDDAILLDSHNWPITHFDVNESINNWATYICVKPHYQAPKLLEIDASLLAVVDGQGQTILGFGGDHVRFEKFEDFWCAKLDGVAQAGLLSDGKSSDRIRIFYRGDLLSKSPIVPKNWNIRVLAKSYVIAGASLALCDNCRRSFIPSGVTTVRAVVPIVEFAVGVPKVFEFRADVGASPGFLSGDDAAKSIIGAGVAPVAGGCLTIDAGIAPRLCGFAVTDFVAVSTTKTGDSSAHLRFAMQPNGLIVAGLTIP